MTHSEHHARPFAEMMFRATRLCALALLALTLLTAPALAQTEEEVTDAPAGAPAPSLSDLVADGTSRAAKSSWSGRWMRAMTRGERRESNFMILVVLLQQKMVLLASVQQKSRHFEESPFCEDRRKAVVGWKAAEIGADETITGGFSASEEGASENPEAGTGVERESRGAGDRRGMRLCLPASCAMV